MTAAVQLLPVNQQQINFTTSMRCWGAPVADLHPARLMAEWILPHEMAAFGSTGAASATTLALHTAPWRWRIRSTSSQRDRHMLREPLTGHGSFFA